MIKGLHYKVTMPSECWSTIRVLSIGGDGFGRSDQRVSGLLVLKCMSPKTWMKWCYYFNCGLQGMGEEGTLMPCVV